MLPQARNGVEVTGQEVSPRNSGTRAGLGWELTGSRRR